MWNCLQADLDTPCTEEDPHVVCFREAGGRLMDGYESLKRDSRIVDYVLSTGNCEVLDAQKHAARMARRDRLTRMENVLLD